MIGSVRDRRLTITSRGAGTHTFYASGTVYTSNAVSLLIINK